jgi:hypothetical protein
MYIYVTHVHLKEGAGPDWDGAMRMSRRRHGAQPIRWRAVQRAGWGGYGALFSASVSVLVFFSSRLTSSSYEPVRITLTNWA